MVYDCVIWYMSCVSSHPLLFLFAWQTLLSFVVGVPYRFSRLLIRHLAMLPRSFVIFGVGVPTCGANLYLSWGVIVGDFNSKPVGFHLGYSVSDLLSIALRCVGCGDGDLSFASQTGRFTTDIQSNGWIKYQRVRQKRKQINVCRVDVTYHLGAYYFAYMLNYVCFKCFISYDLSRILFMDISIKSRSAARGMLAK